MSAPLTLAGNSGTARSVSPGASGRRVSFADVPMSGSDGAAAFSGTATQALLSRMAQMATL